MLHRQRIECSAWGVSKECGGAPARQSPRYAAPPRPSPPASSSKQQGRDDSLLHRPARLTSRRSERGSNDGSSTDLPVQAVQKCQMCECAAEVSFNFYYTDALTGKCALRLLH